jgi:putative membrane protein
MNIFTSFFVSLLAVGLTAYLLPGVALAGLSATLLVVLVLTLINTFIRPILKFLTFPITFMTLGLFSLVLNAVIIMLVDMAVPGFEVDGFISALLFSVILSVVTTVLGWLLK